jgi:hypothetical protein
MTKKKVKHPTTEPGKEQAMVVGQGRLYLVQGRGYVCIAILDANDAWRSYYSNEVLRGRVKVLHEV